MNINVITSHYLRSLVKTKSRLQADLATINNVLGKFGNIKVRPVRKMTAAHKKAIALGKARARAARARASQ